MRGLQKYDFSIGTYGEIDRTISPVSLVPSLFSLARGGKESGEVPIQYLFRAPGSWRSNQIAERELRHHFRERNHIILRTFQTAP